MITHSYSLRSRVSSSSLTVKTPTQSPVSKSGKSPRKGTLTTPSLQLKHVIGTTTSTPNGLSCCSVNDAFAYCAGSVAVLASIDNDDHLVFRYFKARPTASPINQIASYYDSPSTSNTPTRRRSAHPSRRNVDDHGVGTFGSHWLEDGAGQTWSARERIKTASCVSISPNGRILAVGEAGYNPRVLLFSTAPNASVDIPLSIMTDHTIGVRCVAFSPDSKFLATLGDINDGFLYIWAVNTKTGVARLHSSNKCTANVHGMAWCGNSVVTVGTRHVKVWQASTSLSVQASRRSRIKHDAEVASPGPSPLQGRNCLLGTFADAIFTAVVAITDDRAAVCADDGHILLLNLSQGKTELSSLEQTRDIVAAVSYRQDPNRLVWAASNGTLEGRELNLEHTSITISEEIVDNILSQKRGKRSRQSLLRQSLGLSPPKLAKIVALGCLREKLISIDAEGVVRVSRIGCDDPGSDIQQIASHDGPVRGIQALSKEANLGSFFTWDRTGNVRFWGADGSNLGMETVDLDDSFDADDGITNELKVVQYFHDADVFLAGDQFGVLKVVDQHSWKCVNTIRAHSAEISSIAMQGTDRLVATCGRDRMVQLFSLRNHEIDLLQTLDDHISAVSQVIFNQDGNRLLSCSSDRTIVVRERVERKLGNDTVCAFVSTRTVTMKSAPLSMSFVPSQPHTLVVSLLDRHVIQMDPKTGSIGSSFKVSDRDSDDTVSLNTLCLSASTNMEGTCLLAGYSTIDKSIRLYDLAKGSLLGRDSGHTEGISDMIMFQDGPGEGQAEQTTIVSTGLDSTIMIWSATAFGQPLLTPQQELSQSQAMGTDPEKAIFKASPASLPPMRKILSKVDIAEFVRQTSPTREVSPNGLRRKTSRLALSTSIEEADEGPSPTLNRSQSQEWKPDGDKTSPSPPQSVMKPKKQRSRSEMSKSMVTKSASLASAPSLPDETMAIAAAPKHATRANNSRLRRPPSVPSDLRAQAAAEGRRQSMNITSDFGSIGMATEQASRMLKAYRKKLLATREEVELDDVEADLEAVLRTIKQKRARADAPFEVVQTKVMKENIDDEVNGLSVMLEKTNMS